MHKELFPIPYPLLLCGREYFLEQGFSFPLCYMWHLYTEYGYVSYVHNIQNLCAMTEIIGLSEQNLFLLKCCNVFWKS